MTMLARAAAFAALLALAAVPRAEAQVGSVHFTIAGGPTAAFRGETKRAVRIEGNLECPAERDD